jgi:hypothetical protein
MSGSPLVPTAARASHSAWVRDTRGAPPAGAGAMENSPPSSEKPRVAAPPPLSAVTAGPFSPLPTAGPAWHTGRSQVSAAPTAVSFPAYPPLVCRTVLVLQPASSAAAASDPGTHRIPL